MKINIHRDKSSCNSKWEVSLIFKSDKRKRETVLYHETTLQLIEFSDQKIDGIVIPGDVPNTTNYNIAELIKHIRLLPQLEIAKLPIYISNNGVSIIERLEPSLSEGVALIIPSLRFSNLFDYIKQNFKEPLNSLTEERLESIINSIDSKQIIGGHSLSNQWGPYRILKELSQLDIKGIDKKEIENQIRNLEKELSSQLFFKKLIRKYWINKEERDIDADEISDCIDKIKKIKSMNLKIGLIDDEVEKGWGAAYNALLCGNENPIDELYPKLDMLDTRSSEKREKHFDNFLSTIKEGNKFNDYDILLLDLRLHEKTLKGTTEILGVHRLSGIKALKIVKEKNPTLPIILCTASNKAWTQDIGKNLGANGFWTKESPAYGVSPSYSFYNIYDIVLKVDNLIQRQQEIGSIYKGMNEILSVVKEKYPKIEESVKRKSDIIYCELQQEKLDYLREQYDQSGYDFLFLTLWSILNDVKDGMTTKEIVNEKEHFFINNIDGSKLCYAKETQNGKKRVMQYQYRKSGQLVEFETKFGPNEVNLIIFLLLEVYNREDINSEFYKLKSKRNGLDWIHGNSEANKIDISLDDLKIMLGIYYLIFTGKEFN